MPSRSSTAATQRSAIGLRTAPKDLAPWLRIDHFAAILPEGEDDWPRGRGQTFDDYVSLNPTKPAALSSKRVKEHAQGRHKIYLQPLGETSDSFPDLSALAHGCTAFSSPRRSTASPQATR